MKWLTLYTGPYVGNSLPQVVFKDPYYFFRALDAGEFEYDPELLRQAKYVAYRAQRIRIPFHLGPKCVALYVVNKAKAKLESVEIYSKAELFGVGTDSEVVKSVIDLRMLFSVGPHDVSEMRPFLWSIKKILFGETAIRFTRRRCEPFFENGHHFEIVKRERVSISKSQSGKRERVRVEF